MRREKSDPKHISYQKIGENWWFSMVESIKNQLENKSKWIMVDDCN